MYKFNLITKIRIHCGKKKIFATRGTNPRTLSFRVPYHPTKWDVSVPTPGVPLWTPLTRLLRWVKFSVFKEYRKAFRAQYFPSRLFFVYETSQHDVWMQVTYFVFIFIIYKKKKNVGRYSFRSKTEMIFNNRFLSLILIK